MSRLWIGVAILVILLSLGLSAALATDRFQADVSLALVAAGDAAAAGEWHRAETHFFQAEAIWRRHRSLNAAITDHAPMEEIDRFFLQGTVYLEERSRKDFRACCRALSCLVEAVAEAQAITWWSLF